MWLHDISLSVQVLSRWTAYIHINKFCGNWFHFKYCTLKCLDWQLCPVYQVGSQSLSGMWCPCEGPDMDITSHSTIGIQLGTLDEIASLSASVYSIWSKTNCHRIYWCVHIGLCVHSLQRRGRVLLTLISEHQTMSIAAKQADIHLVITFDKWRHRSVMTIASATVCGCLEKIISSRHARLPLPHVCSHTENE